MAAPTPRLVLSFEPGEGPAEILGTWGLPTDDAIDEPDGVHSIPKALTWLQVYEVDVEP